MASEFLIMICILMGMSSIIMSVVICIGTKDTSTELQEDLPIYTEFQIPPPVYTI
jgi:hypothetical protein